MILNHKNISYCFTREHLYQTKDNKLKRNFSHGSLSDDQYKSRDNSPPARGDHPPFRRSLTSSCEPEDENLDELIPGGTVLQLSRYSMFFKLLMY